MSTQLGRPARGVRAVAHRCECGLPDVVETEPRLPDGTPFPTLFYVTCPRLASAIGRLESARLMREMTDRLATDPGLAERYRRAHEIYLERRETIEHVPEIAGVSAGGMPDRVKCLHVLAGHSLAAGPGVNPLGDETLAALPPWGDRGPCLPVTSAPSTPDKEGGRSGSPDEEGASGPPDMEGDGEGVSGSPDKGGDGETPDKGGDGEAAVT